MPASYDNSSVPCRLGMVQVSEGHHIHVVSPPRLSVTSSRRPIDRSHADTSKPSRCARLVSACFCSVVTRTRIDSSFRWAFGFLRFMRPNVALLGFFCNPLTPDLIVLH